MKKAYFGSMTFRTRGVGIALITILVMLVVFFAMRKKPRTKRQIGCWMTNRMGYYWTNYGDTRQH